MTFPNGFTLFNKVETLNEVLTLKKMLKGTASTAAYKIHTMSFGSSRRWVVLDIRAVWPTSGEIRTVPAVSICACQNMKLELHNFKFPTNPTKNRGFECP